MIQTQFTSSQDLTVLLLNGDSEVQSARHSHQSLIIGHKCWYYYATFASCLFFRGNGVEVTSQVLKAKEAG